MTMFVNIMIGLLALAIALAAIRLVRGPGLANRVVALDVIAVLGAALTALFAIHFDLRVFLDVTIVLALVSFVGTVAFSYYIQRGAH
ncbi:MAG: pesticidal protein Cry22Aa [Phycisphaerae bacterium]|nr:pesticidal protein Cry22Aa [Phycisphaerae bacterium]